MRPCNQCRKPIENAREICEQCEEKNRAQGIKHKPSVSIAPIDSTNRKPVPWDQSINMVVLSLLFCAIVVMGGTGFLLDGIRGLIIGGLLALLSPFLVSTLLR